MHHTVHAIFDSKQVSKSHDGKPLIAPEGQKYHKTFAFKTIEDRQAFINSINCTTLKEKPSTESEITIVIHDPKINQAAELGFSIKSQIGSDSTLLNAGKTTNFIFQIEGFDGTALDIDRINAIDSRSKIKDRLEAIKKLGGSLKFHSLEQDIFKNNLTLIDSLLPNLLAELLKQFYTSTQSSMRALTDHLNEENPLGYDTQFSHSFYAYKLKRFLTDVALGMMPSKVWTGELDATGGYLVVKKDGEILCYHVYNRNDFETYLFNNTKLETASSTRHGFGMIYSKNQTLFFNLNLQIRFL